MNKLIETWQRGGLRYFAIRKDSGVHIVDENGGNYGSYRSADSFRKREPEPPIGTVARVTMVSTYESTQ